MNPIKRLLPSHTELSEDQADQLTASTGDWQTVEVRPSRNADHPNTLDAFVRGIREVQTKWLKIWNTSPVAAYEIRRPTSDTVRLQFSVPTHRLERKLRTHLANQLPNIELKQGENGLPVSEGDTVGGGLVTVGRRDWYPLQTDFQDPPINKLVGALHRHAMQDTGIIVQILFQPVAGDPLSKWWRNWRAFKRINYLRKDSESLFGSHSPTRSEKRRAQAIDRKTSDPGFQVSIRLLFIGSGEYTRSRVKELAGAFNIYENPDTGQYLRAETVQTLPSRIFDFASTVQQRRFGGWHRSFHASTAELAGLVSIPDHQQQNIQYAKP